MNVSLATDLLVATAHAELDARRDAARSRSVARALRIEGATRTRRIGPGRSVRR